MRFATQGSKELIMAGEPSGHKKLLDELKTLTLSWLWHVRLPLTSPIKLSEV